MCYQITSVAALMLAVSVNDGSDELSTSANIIDDLSSLSYMDVNIRCNPNEIRKAMKALCDSGSEMSLVNSELLNDFDCHVVGKVQLKPFTGDSISADVVRVNIANGCNCDFDAGVYLHCAVVADLNDEMILAENATARLLQTGSEQSDLDVVLNDVASVDCNECTNDVTVHDVTRVAAVNDAAVITRQ